jgi:hypothetical protein
MISMAYNENEIPGFGYHHNTFSPIAVAKATVHECVNKEKKTPLRAGRPFGFAAL